MGRKPDAAKLEYSPYESFKNKFEEVFTEMPLLPKPNAQHIAFALEAPYLSYEPMITAEDFLRSFEPGLTKENSIKKIEKPPFCETLILSVSLRSSDMRTCVPGTGFNLALEVLSKKLGTEKHFQDLTREELRGLVDNSFEYSDSQATFDTLSNLLIVLNILLQDETKGIEESTDGLLVEDKHSTLIAAMRHLDDLLPHTNIAHTLTGQQDLAMYTFFKDKDISTTPIYCLMDIIYRSLSVFALGGNTVDHKQSSMLRQCADCGNLFFVSHRSSHLHYGECYDKKTREQNRRQKEKSRLKASLEKYINCNIHDEGSRRVHSEILLFHQRLKTRTEELSDRSKTEQYDEIINFLEAEKARYEKMHEEQMAELKSR